MCEPSHSIIQYNPPEHDDDGDGPGSSMSAQAGQYSRDGLLAGLGQWAKKIRGWMHLSMLGKGHSETLGARSNGLMYRYNDVFRLYEAHWWNRKVIRDGALQRGGYASNVIITQQQLDAATNYANLVSIGDLGQLRRFLEQSLAKTDRSQAYLNQFRAGFLNVDGRIQFDKDCKEILKVSPSVILDQAVGVVNSPVGKADPSKGRPLSLESVTKFILGFTRKRKLIVPEWADDASLWTSGLGKPKLA
jgi:hypothetical protein